MLAGGGWRDFFIERVGRNWGGRGMGVKEKKDVQSISNNPIILMINRNMFH